MELRRVLEERQAGVAVHHVLDEPQEILGENVGPRAPREHVDEPRGLVVASRQHPVARGGVSVDVIKRHFQIIYF